MQQQIIELPPGVGPKTPVHVHIQRTDDGSFHVTHAEEGGVEETLGVFATRRELRAALEAFFGDVLQGATDGEEV